MSKRGADTRAKRIARRIVADMSDADSEGVLLAPTDLEDMLHRVQSEAISLSVSISEMIGLMKRQDPEYAAEIYAMENPGETAADPTEPDAEPDESDEPESEDEKE